MQGRPPAAPGLDELPYSTQCTNLVLAPEKAAGFALGLRANVPHTQPAVLRPQQAAKKEL